MKLLYESRTPTSSQRRPGNGQQTASRQATPALDRDDRHAVTRVTR